MTRLTRSEEKERHKAVMTYYKKNIKKWEKDGFKREEIYDLIQEKFGFRNRNSVRNLICKFLREEEDGLDGRLRRKIAKKEELERQLEQLKKELGQH